MRFYSYLSSVWNYGSIDEQDEKSMRAYVKRIGLFYVFLEIGVMDGLFVGEALIFSTPPFKAKTFTEISEEESEDVFDMDDY